jgi:ubiquinone/menaquinone biosynthesis C-methylase UbiE
MRGSNTAIGQLHTRHVAGRRVERLAGRLAPLLPPGARVLDVGCGDGAIARRIMDMRPDVAVRGVDVLIRPDTAIPIEPFDGCHLPAGDEAVDTVMLVDVLHHTEDPRVLLNEARRVARRSVVIKDHTRDGWFARQTLQLMDWVGNAHHGVALPYTYWSRTEWQQAFRDLELRIERWAGRLDLYPLPASLVFDRSLHFTAVLRKA